MEGAEQMSYPQPTSGDLRVTRSPIPTSGAWNPTDAEMAGAERIEPRVIHHLAKLEHQLKGLADEIERLEQRVSLVLVPPSPHAMPDQSPGDETLQSPIAKAVGESWARLAELRRRLTSIIDRVEV